MRPRGAFLRVAEIRAVPLAGPFLLGPAARGGMAGGQAEVGWCFSGVFGLAVPFGATRPPTRLGALPMTLAAAATAPAPAAEGASPSTAISRPNSAGMLS